MLESSQSHGVFSKIPYADEAWNQTANSEVALVDRRQHGSVQISETLAVEDIFAESDLIALMRLEDSDLMSYGLGSLQYRA